MKTKRLELYSWFSTDDRIEIDWPKVHKTLGTDQTRWLLDQNNTACQLVVDKVNNNYTLVAEFYDNKTLTAYHLMWAK
jgi:hypothetical protein